MYLDELYGNVAELLTHARTVDTKCFSLIFVKRLGMRLCSFKSFIQAKGSKSSRLCEDTSLAGKSKVWYTSTRGSHIHIACRSICDQDQESWSAKSPLIALFRGSWSLNSMRVQKTKHSHTPRYLRKCVDQLILVLRINFVLIPWSAPTMKIAKCFYRWRLYTPWSKRLRGVKNLR